MRTEKNVVKNGVETNYKYTWSDNKLVHQVCGNENLHFYYDSNDEITGFSRDDGTKVTYYSYVKNIQGDIIEIIDENGNSIATYSYDAWGVFGGGSGSMNISPIRYRGYYFDSEISMYYLQSRYYNPRTARFLNADDTDYIGYTKSMLSYNMFVYCENNSVNMIDSAGTDAMFLFSNAQTYYIRHGHAAILFESYGGWYYFSDNGTGGKSKTKFDFRYIGSSYYFNYGSELSNNYYEAQWQIQHPPKKVSLNKKMALLKNRLRSLGNKKSIYYIKPLTLDTKTYCDFYYIKGNFNSLHNYITTKLMKTQHNTIFNNCLKYACYSLLHGYFSNSYERHAYECALWCITPIKANIGLKFFYATYKLYYSIPWYFRSNKITPYSLFY